MGLSSVLSHPYLYNPYYKFFRYNTAYYNSYGNYAHQISNYAQFTPTYTDVIKDSALSAYLSTPETLPTLNVLAEVPYAITNRFTVVPMFAVAQENMNLISNAHIMNVSNNKPVMTVKTEQNELIQCTPAVKIFLEKPITIFSLKASILFPSEIEIVHEGFRIPIRIGAIIAPIEQDTYVSVETPVAVNIVYAVPTKPITINYVNPSGIETSDNQAVVVESEPLPSRPNVTIIDFPDKEAEPILQVDELNEELVNRNPPILLAPAGIVQSTQPITHIEQFTNSKESPVLIALREEALKRI